MKVLKTSFKSVMEKNTWGSNLATPWFGYSSARSEVVPGILLTLTLHVGGFSSSVPYLNKTWILVTVEVTKEVGKLP